MSGKSSAGSRTVYRRYLRKFICAVPRVHGENFKRSSHIFQRVYWENWKLLFRGRILRDVTLVAEDVHQDRRLQKATATLQPGLLARPWAHMDRHLGRVAGVCKATGKARSTRNRIIWQWTGSSPQMLSPMDSITGADPGHT